MAARALDLPGIKTQIKAQLDAVITTTLSTNLSTNVQKILKINPELIPPQPSFYPCVSVYYDNKSIDLIDIATNQDNGKRQSLIEIKIAGILWNDNFADVVGDPADDDCEVLMENIELVLRQSDTTFNGLVLHSKPTAVTYHSYPVSEDTHFRVGLLTLEAKAHY